MSLQHNSYFDGAVQSIGFEADGERLCAFAWVVVTNGMMSTISPRPIRCRRSGTILKV